MDDIVDAVTEETDETSNGALALLTTLGSLAGVGIIYAGVRRFRQKRKEKSALPPPVVE